MRKLNNKNYLIIFSVLIFAILGGVFCASGTGEMALLGKDQADILRNGDDTIVASVNGEKIPKKSVDSFKVVLNSSLNNSDHMYTDEEVLDKMIEKILLYQTALNAGISVSSEDVDKLMQQSKDALALEVNKKDAATIAEYISGMNITEDEYWELVRPLVKRDIVCGRYKYALRKNFSEANNITDIQELKKEFDAYFIDYMEQLKENADIQINK